eukprot:TRINITY_DN425_c0_g1_i10.p1 TRINITY_DN425_c0_g1~~TRINITY_DN425_c0_g1_i10.p1  ORF type:complete len:144 (-),score=42.73 TRINITY_DN425_c0_g1_i10:56-487(-)
MGSVLLTSLVETHQVFDRVVERNIEMSAAIRISVGVLVTIVAISTASPSPLRLRRAPQETSNRFFTGNSAIDAGAAGAALGAAAQFFGNQVLNPCRGGTRSNNKDTNNRFLGGQTIQNGALGFLAGFAGSSLINNALGNPCGK